MQKVHRKPDTKFPDTRKAARITCGTHPGISLRIAATMGSFRQTQRKRRATLGAYFIYHANEAVTGCVCSLPRAASPQRFHPPLSKIRGDVGLTNCRGRAHEVLVYIYRFYRSPARRKYKGGGINGRGLDACERSATALPHHPPLLSRFYYFVIAFFGCDSLPLFLFHVYLVR